MKETNKNIKPYDLLFAGLEMIRRKNGWGEQKGLLAKEVKKPLFNIDGHKRVIEIYAEFY